MEKVYKEDVAEFYDESSGGVVYGTFVYPMLGAHQHYGFWYEDTKTYREAANNEVECIIEKGGINSKSIVLDAGCGVGGAAIHIAKKQGHTWTVVL